MSAEVSSNKMLLWSMPPFYRNVAITFNYGFAYNILDGVHNIKNVIKQKPIIEAKFIQTCIANCISPKIIMFEQYQKLSMTNKFGFTQIFLIGKYHILKELYGVSVFNSPV